MRISSYRKTTVVKKVQFHSHWTEAEMMWLSLTLCILLYNSLATGLSEHCSTFRSQRYGHAVVKEEGGDDNGFLLEIRRASDGAMVDGWFEPGKDYTVKLTNRKLFITFNDFLVWLSPSQTKELQSIERQNETELASKLSPNSVGSWIHLGPRGRQSRSHVYYGTRNRNGCQGVVVEKRSTSFSRRHISSVAVGWRAPSGSSSECITIHGMVHTFNTVWKEVGGLMKTICPSKMRPMEPVLSSAEEPESNSSPSNQNYPRDMRAQDTMQASDCCACGTATYQLTFQGLWNRTTHPKDWPVKNPNLLHWTNLIGASHSPSYTIYAIGQPASAGVQSVCAYGDTTVMRQALSLAASKSEGSANVPTGSASASTDVSPLYSLISTPGMWGEEVLMETRTTLLSVNRTHPLISMLTMLGPSPDWCTGFSGQSLCQSDCTWIDNITLHLYPWDAGIRNGNTYMPKDADRRDVPDLIRYIDEKWMPGNPFYERKPIAKVSIVRISPKHRWQCTKDMPDGVHLFEMGGGIHVTGDTERKKETKGDESARQVGGGKKRNKGGKSDGFGGPGGSGTIGTNNPLSDPSLAQMATFLCITGDWSAWSACSVTCGVGSRTRHREMISNKKPELCQHVPLSMTEACEGRKRTCDFSALCSFLPWTTWTPCNATCEFPRGVQMRKQALARPTDEGCEDLFSNDRERSMKMRIDTQVCEMSSDLCDPATICGEGPKEGFPCGKPSRRFYYSAIEHECLPFNYLGCKGGRNLFEEKTECRNFCISAVEALPAWRRERMGLLQFKTSQIRSLDESSNANGGQTLKQDEACHFEVNVGEECDESKEWGNYWYFCPRTHRCRDFVYLGCKGTANRFTNHTACMQACMPDEYFRSQQLSKVREAAMKSSSYSSSSSSLSSSPGPSDNDNDGIELEGFGINPKQDCRVTRWGAWGPCSVRCASQSKTGYQMRLRAIQRPSRYGGVPCGPLFEKRVCFGTDPSC